MATDPFEHFGEQQQSFEMLEEHRHALLDDARELLQKHPQLEVVGLILDGSASEAAEFHAKYAPKGTPPVAGSGVLAVVPRAIAIQMLRKHAPAMLDWLPPSQRPDGSRALPLCAVTRNGYRFGAIAYEC